MTKEIWKTIDGFPGYEVSSEGRIRSFRDYHGNITDSYRFLRFVVSKGYYCATLYTSDRKKVTKRVHRLVAETFLGKHYGLVVNHLNGDKLDNRVENLEWTTPKENSSHASRIGLYKTKPIEIVETGERFNSIVECADALHLHPSTVSHYLIDGIDSITGLHFRYIDDGNVKKKKPFLYDYQLDAVKKLHNGSILCGSVGSGKSRTGLFYYFKENEGWIDENGYKPMKDPSDLYIITTAKKRDSLEWNGELANFCMSPNPEANYYKNKIVIDSWNNIGKYKDVSGAFFLLDEQRLVGAGAWVKAFLKIAKNNKWILLTATPGDSYNDYVPVFIANGFFKNRTEFNREHVIYSRFTKYPKIDRYINTRRLDRLRDRILVKMNYKHQINAHKEVIYCDYDILKYKEIFRKRWDIYREEPIINSAGLCYTLRRVVNSDESRQEELLKILNDHPKAIIFYNHNYEVNILKDLPYTEGTEVAEYNGSKHQEVPHGNKWVYLVQYNAGCEGWECVRTNCTIFYSQNYSYKMMTQAAGRIDRLNTPFSDLYYFYLTSRSGIDLAISKALREKKNFNESKYVNW